MARPPCSYAEAVTDLAEGDRPGARTRSLALLAAETGERQQPQPTCGRGVVDGEPLRSRGRRRGARDRRCPGHLGAQRMASGAPGARAGRRPARSLQPSAERGRLISPSSGRRFRRCLYGEAFPMTRSDRTFPVGPRLLALCAAIVALLVSVPMAGASTPSPSKSQVQSAHQAYVDAQARISQYRSQIESVQVQLTAAVDKLDQLQARARADPVADRRDEGPARARAGALRADPRAARASAPPRRSSPGRHPTSRSSSGATSMDDLSDRMEFVDAVTQSDAALAQQVAEPQGRACRSRSRALQELEAQAAEAGRPADRAPRPDLAQPVLHQLATRRGGRARAADAAEVQDL